MPEVGERVPAGVGAPGGTRPAGRRGLGGEGPEKRGYAQ